MYHAVATSPYWRRGNTPEPPPQDWDRDDFSYDSRRVVPVVRAEDVGELPPTYKGESAESPVAVDTRALRHFADAMDQLIAPLNDAWQDLERSGELAAGRFRKADEISERANAMRSQYIVKLKKFREAYVSLREGMLTLADTYDRVEADSGEAATRANSVVTNFKSNMPQG
ncbi:hypothetical protein QTQ03_18480 [Micromonospora sp. WMMA1363]|uniref:hypothetical protein n=1 Tax=Micromonospora sp. WMMA1363 TaxID=3053985 RepID=UPI00259CF6FA|nr:hypothetical protein [Micromonospora sp. WMMA1363]MDM4721484.1 hypothetical protein [Micromonospora sp. WMMA1363]